jgi:maltose O-acetyltransferase
MKKILEKIILYIYQKGRALDREARYSTFRKKYKLALTFRFNGDNIKFYGDGDITIGEGSYIGEHSTIQVATSNRVSIGRNCAISHNVRIYTTTTVAAGDWSKNEREKKHADVIIEDNVWIGANVFINPGVIIGNNSIIGANSVVTKSIEPFSIVGGVPAKFIKNKER